MSLNLRSVLISDPVDEQCAALLTSHGLSVTRKYKLSKEELIKELKKHDGLIVRSETKVTADVIDASPNLRLVGRAGTGVDNIDIPAATRNGVLVLKISAPGGNSTSACELTCAMIGALARNVVQACQSMREGRWDRKLYAGHELAGKTLGVLGYGRIGRMVASRMKAHGMRVIVLDANLSSEQTDDTGITRAGLDYICANADYITIHTALLPKTKNLINAATLSKCKRGVRIVNVARGGIVDEAALLDSIRAGHCAAAALDVFSEEPPKSPISLELIGHPCVIATPHLGGSTTEAQTRVAVEIAEQLLALSGRSDGYAVRGIVNAPAMSATLDPVNAAWIKLARRLGTIGANLLARQSDARVQSCTTGSGMAGKQFVHAAVQLGLLSARAPIGRLNLVNAPCLADELAVQLDESHENGPIDSLVLRVAAHQLQGTVVGKATLLLSIDGETFGDDGLHIQDNVTLYRAKTQQDLAHLVAAHVARGIAVRNVSIAGHWIVVQTSTESNDESLVHVDAVPAYGLEDSSSVIETRDVRKLNGSH